jgi:hypothetical protein
MADYAAASTISVVGADTFPDSQANLEDRISREIVGGKRTGKLHLNSMGLEHLPEDVWYLPSLTSLSGTFVRARSWGAGWRKTR